jgi:hypothetical protein
MHWHELGRVRSGLVAPDFALVSGSGDTSYVNDVHLSGQLELGNVLVTTYNDGASATGLLTLDADANVQWSTGNRLTLWADNGISLKGKVNALPGGIGTVVTAECQPKTLVILSPGRP